MADRDDRAELGEQQSEGNEIERNDSVEDLRASDRENNMESENESTDFEGRGGQMEADASEAQGTGYTNDSNRQLQEDGDMSASEGRQSRNGNRQGARRIMRSSPNRERKGGQTAQNPRGSETDDLDRSVM